MSVVITGADDVHRMLAKAMDPQLKKSLQKATNAGAKFLKPKVKAAAPRRTGLLAKSVSSGQAKRGRDVIRRCMSRSPLNHDGLKLLRRHRTSPCVPDV